MNKISIHSTSAPRKFYLVWQTLDKSLSQLIPDNLTHFILNVTSITRFRECLFKFLIGMWNGNLYNMSNNPT